MPKDADPESHIAAGPWSFCGQEKEFKDWENLFTFAPEPLANPELLPVACRAAQTLCVKLIPETAKLLTQKPDCLPDIYWQILLCPWLIDFTSQIVDRALRCKAILEAYGSLQLIVPLWPANYSFEFVDEHDFTLRGCLGLAYNHWLFSRLLENKWPESWKKVFVKPEVPPKQITKQNKGFSVKASIRNLVLRLPFPKMKGVSIATSLRLSKALLKPRSAADHSLNLSKCFDYQEDLDKVPLLDKVVDLLKPSLPESLINLSHKPVRTIKSRPKLKIAALASHEDARYRQSLAYWRAEGNMLAHVQHGGNYGQVATPCAASVVEYSQDAFFTWGWSSQGKAEGNFVPLPSLQLSACPSWEEGKDLLFVGAEMPAYGRRLDSHPTPMQYLKYRRAKAVFFSELGPEFQKKTLYRPYFDLPGTLLDAGWLQTRFPLIKICKGKLSDYIAHCHLLIVDHHGTTLLEAMAANIPVIAYWNRDYWPLCPECKILIEALEAAGIWFGSAESAARKAKEIWSDPAAWWNAEDIQLVRQIFCKNQAFVEDNPVNQWEKALKLL